MTLESEPEDGETDLLTLGERADGMIAETDLQKAVGKRYVLWVPKFHARPLSLTRSHSRYHRLLHRLTKRKRPKGSQNWKPGNRSKLQRKTASRKSSNLREAPVICSPRSTKKRKIPLL